MNLTNYHSHCTFCDGRAPMEEYVKTAIQAGFTVYGVSSHAPLPFPTEWTMPMEQLPAYLRELGRLKEKYAGQIELCGGLEIDYLNDRHNAAIPLFQELPLDYRIGSVHLVYTDEEEIVDTDTGGENFKRLADRYFRGDVREIARRYYEACEHMLECGGFDFVGHADKIAWNMEYCRPGITDELWYKNLRDGFFALVARKGMMLEINTKAYLSKGCFFPGESHYTAIRELNIPVVVNSDAHFPDLINAGRREALEALTRAGFRSVMELHAGEWREMPIDVSLGQTNRRVNE